MEISVIVPVYRTEQYIKRCIESLLEQTYQDFEIILIDDGSDDGAPAICDEYAQKQENITVLHKENGGLSSARNAGLAIAQGKYIAFIDSDDFVANDYLETLHTLLMESGADIAKIDYTEVKDSSIPSIAAQDAKMEIFYGRDIQLAFQDLKVDSVCVFLYKKEILQHIRFQDGKTSEDIPFNFEVFLNCTSLAYKNVYKYMYYYNPESISNGCLDKNMLNYTTFRKEIYEYYLLKEDTELVSKSEVAYARALMGLLFRMALFGVADNMNEKEERASLIAQFKPHSISYYKDQTIPMFKKIASILVLYFYPVFVIARRLRK